jgi:hypothetical protein
VSSGNDGSYAKATAQEFCERRQLRWYFSRSILARRTNERRIRTEGTTDKDILIQKPLAPDQQGSRGFAMKRVGIIRTTRASGSENSNHPCDPWSDFPITAISYDSGDYGAIL